MNNEKSNLGIYTTILNSIQEQIRFADSKAGFVAALNAILFGFIASNFDNLRSIYLATDGKNAALWITLILLGLHFVCTAFSVGLITSAVISRFGELAPQSRVFFGHIAKSYGREYEKYVKETISLSEREWAEQIGTQIVEISNVALTKHQLVRRAIYFTLVAFVLWIASLVALALLPT